MSFNHMRPKTKRLSAARATAAVGLTLAAAFSVVFTSKSDAQAPKTTPLRAAPNLQQQVNEAFGLTQSTLQGVQLQAAPEGKGEGLSAALVLDGELITLSLKPSSLRAANYQVLAQLEDGTLAPVEPSPDRTFRGEVNEIPGSVAAGSILDDGLHAVILMPDGTKFWVEPAAARLPAGAGVDADLHVVYRNDAVIASGGTCGNDNLAIQHDHQANPQPIGATGPVCFTQLACDADVEYYQAYGSSVAAVENRIHLVINTMNPQYENQVGITHIITTILVRTAEPDPYTSFDSDTLLCQFITQWTNNHANIQRDVAKLFTGRNISGGTIGQAANFGEICDNAGFCQTPPTADDGGFCYSQSDCCGSLACATDLAAHELGHLWDATHCSCPSSTMNPSITCANSFNAGSINQIVAFRNTVGCLNCVNPPPNDDCTGAIVVGNGTTNFNTTNATTSGPNEPNLCTSFGYTQIGADIWYRYTATCTGVVTVDLCNSSYDTKVAVYTNCPSGANQAIACNDDSCGTRSKVTFPAVQGNQYRIRIGGYQSATGSGQMVISCTIAGDACSDAIAVGNGSHAFSTVGATTDGPNEPGQCDFFGYTQVGNDVWYRYTAVCTGLARASLCNADYDSKVAVYGASCPASAAAIACNDDACGTSGTRSNVIFPTVAGNQYLIRIGGFQGATGGGTLRITCPANDDCDGALAVLNGAHAFSNIGATTDGPSEPAQCNFFSYPQVGNDIWYRYLALCNSQVTIRLCSSNYDSKIAVYSGDLCPTVASAVACNDDACGTGNQSRVTFNAVNGNFYRIRIGGFQSATGSGSMVITCCAADITFDGLVNVNDLLGVINGWGACAAPPGACNADVTGDLNINVNDLLGVINGWGPCP